MVDYSSWNRIEVSDDEDDTHPHVDTPSLFKWRHDARLQRMQEMEEEKQEIQKRKEVLQAMKLELEAFRKNSDSAAELAKKEKLFNMLAEEVAKLEADFLKKEKLSPWNVDTIAQDGFSKTVINTKKPKSKENTAKLSEEERGNRLIQFKEDNMENLEKFGMLSKYEDSKRFLQNNPQLLCEDTVNYLGLWCIDLAIEQKFELMNHVSHQYLSIKFLLELAEQLDCDPRACVAPYFAKLKESLGYQDEFSKELDKFCQHARRRAGIRIQEMIATERKARLGPGGLDPFEVLESLPEALRTCFETRDIPLLQKTIAEMPQDQAAHHMKRCMDAGLWHPEKSAKKEKVEQDQVGLLRSANGIFFAGVIVLTISILVRVLLTFIIF